MAESMASHEAGGAILMVGNSTTQAPSLSIISAKSDACSLALVTTILFPNKGLVSNHLNFSLNDTTPPTTATAGGLKLAVFAFSAISSTVPTNVSCSGVVPHRIRATGVFGDRKSTRLHSS